MSFPRVQKIVLEILRNKFGDEVNVGSWGNDIDYREYPYINVRRLGGVRSTSKYTHLDKPVIEMTVYHGEGLIEAEELYIQALEALFEARKKQTVTKYGWLSTIKETMGPTQISSLYVDSWRVQGLILLGIRAPEKEK